MFSSIDIHEQLLKARQKHQKTYTSLANQVQTAIKQGKQADEYILHRLNNTPKPGKLNINSELLENNRIFSTDDIKAVCVDYRLRFIDSKYFKIDALPNDAVNTAKNLEKYLGKDIKQQKIMAMGKFFKIEDAKKEPLLFASIDETNYYLIHKWEKTIPWYNKILAYPLRSILTLLFSFMLIALPLVFLIPTLIFNSPKAIHYYQMLYMAAFTVTAIFIIVFGGFTFHKKFSKMCWNTPAIS